MILYSIFMFLAAVPIGIISIAIYRGKTNLIHYYHQTKVKDKAAYGRAFGKALLTVSLALFLSGTVGLFGDEKKIAFIAILVLFIGLAIGITGIVIVQRKYNRGIF